MQVYLSPDGNWGDAYGLLTFDITDLPVALYNNLVEDPEGAYDEVSEYLYDNGKL